MSIIEHQLPLAYAGIKATSRLIALRSVIPLAAGSVPEVELALLALRSATFAAVTVSRL